MITLGIIGVVSALTIPTLIQNHRKQVIETKLKKFYSTINNALEMSKSENGERSTWIIKDSTIDEYYNQYWKNYIHSLKTETIGNQKIIYFQDGCAMRMDIWGEGTNGGHFYFCPKSADCKIIEDKNIGKTAFVFAFWTDTFNAFKIHGGKGIEPYAVHWNGSDLNALYNYGKLGCSTGRGFYCTKIIQLNGWKIPDNYPFRF